MAILAPAADTLLAAALTPEPSARSLYVADTLTDRALAPSAGRAGYTLRRAPEGVWCDDPRSERRAVGVMLRLRLHRLVGDSATVWWGLTCLLGPREGSTPIVGGEGGLLEVVRERGRWRVTRSLFRVEM